MLLWKVMVVWLRRIYYTILKIIRKDEKWNFLVKKFDLSGISSQMNIPTPYALKASFQIFGWGMRTHAPSRSALGAGFDERTGQPTTEKRKSTTLRGVVI